MESLRTTCLTYLKNKTKSEKIDITNEICTKLGFERVSGIFNNCIKITPACIINSEEDRLNLINILKETHVTISCNLHNNFPSIENKLQNFLKQYNVIIYTKIILGWVTRRELDYFHHDDSYPTELKMLLDCLKEEIKDPTLKNKIKMRKQIKAELEVKIILSDKIKIWFKHQKLKNHINTNIEHKKIKNSLENLDVYKKDIEEIMINLNKQITCSYSAYITTKDETVKPTQPIPKELLNEYIRIVNIYNDTLKNLKKNNLTKDDLKKYLRIGYTTTKAYACNDLALHISIKLREYFSKQGKQQLAKDVRVCQVGGHVMCCIGNPKNDKSLIIDPWIKYLNLPQKIGNPDNTQNYRPKEIKWNNKNRIKGFLGRVKEYKKFLQNHPNQYVPLNYPTDIIEHEIFNDFVQTINSSEIEEPLKI